ncbi:MAG: glycosyltransferase family 2 protein [Lewinellaceae bacterium]|nr:glycosyltransferase family 2 protein [Lewinellaceae bacterium]
MSKPTLALCIPAYNAAEYLPRLLKSAQDQAIPFDEILVYNDCSIDNTAFVAEKFGAQVINGDINRGCSEGKNRLAEVTKSEWIHFHDADDELMPNFTTLAHKWMAKSHPPEVVLFPYEWRDDRTNGLLNVRKFDREALEKDPIEYAILEQINPFCGLYKKDKMLEAGGYDTDPLVLYNEDVAFHLRLAIAGLRFSAEEEISIINYRISNSMSAANQIKCNEAHFQVLKKAAAQVGDRYPKTLALKLWKAAGVAASQKNFKTADKCIELAINLNGNNPVGQGKAFSMLAGVNPYLAIRFREYLITWFNPDLRKQSE